MLTVGDKLPDFSVVAAKPNLICQKKMAKARSRQ